MSNLSINTVTGIPPAEKWKSFKYHNLFDIQNILGISEAVTDLDLWQWFKNVKPPEGVGYIFWNHDNLLKIQKHEASKIENHSECSWSITLRNIQFIAVHGFEEWDNYIVKQYTK